MDLSLVKGETCHMANDQLLTLLNLSRKEVVKVWPKYGFGLKSLPNEDCDMGYQPEEELRKEKNPKQVLIDWVTEVQKAANQVCKDIDRNCFLHAKETTNYILGQCNTMMTVLKNTD